MNKFMVGGESVMKIIMQVSVIVVTGLRGNIDQTKDDRDFMMDFYWNNFNVGWWQEAGCWNRIVNGKHDPTPMRSPVSTKNMVPSWEKFFVCYMVREPWFCYSNNFKWRRVDERLKCRKLVNNTESFPETNRYISVESLGLGATGVNRTTSWGVCVRTRCSWVVKLLYL